jgi:acetoacetyl-CoA synthetase
MSYSLEQDIQQRTTSKKIEEMTALWERLLQKSLIHADDNFFELGGNPRLAERLFAEIERIHGQRIDPAAIYHLPTIRALAAAIGQPTARIFPPLIPMNNAGAGRPVFIAPGLGGSVLEFFDLVKQMRSRHPIYGMQAIGSDGAEVAFERIEEMAQCYLSAIQKLQPRGPYLLAGYSLGGLVALEVAQHLSRLQEKIGLLVLMDAYPHPHFLSANQRLHLTVQLAIRHASVLRRLPYRSALRYLFDPAERLLHAAAVEGRGDSALAKPALDYVSDNAYLALTRYRPAPYAGAIKFVRAAVTSVFPEDAGKTWSGLANELDIEDIPGNHYEMLTKNVDSLAAVLSRYLQTAA